MKNTGGRLRKRPPFFMLNHKHKKSRVGTDTGFFYRLKDNINSSYKKYVLRLWEVFYLTVTLRPAEWAVIVGAYCDCIVAIPAV